MKQIDKYIVELVVELAKSGEVEAIIAVVDVVVQVAKNVGLVVEVGKVYQADRYAVQSVRYRGVQPIWVAWVGSLLATGSVVVNPRYRDYFAEVCLQLGLSVEVKGEEIVLC